MAWHRLFKRRRATAHAPAGERLYAVGDIHGRRDLFEALLWQIARDDANRPRAFTRLILLGDLINRGPDSCGVIDLALTLGCAFDDVRWLVGNHEEMLLGALGGRAGMLRHLVRAGGGATIRSYGMSAETFARIDFAELAAILPTLVPSRHCDFLATGEDMVELGDYVFVHAGVRPGIALQDQRIEDLRWIRDEFLHDHTWRGPVVVHGHSISDRPVVSPHRIGIDTGAYISGRLTALGLEGGHRWFLSAEG